MPQLSSQFQSRTPSAVRLAQIEFLNRRKTGSAVDAINVSIGNVSLPMHPAMTKRLKKLGSKNFAFSDGIVRYTDTIGTPKAIETVKHILTASGADSSDLKVLITSGGSQAMELAVMGTGGPILLLDAAYPNYLQFAARLKIPTASITRHMNHRGEFALPTTSEIESAIQKHKPSALVIIPYDNPTGQFYSQKDLEEIAKICVKHDLWIIGDEAYRELFYTKGESSSIWKITEDKVAGIGGRRVGIESTSKVWNACGLRIGALVTDNSDFLRQAVAENTANLAASTIGQEVFSALLEVSIPDLHKWFRRQRKYYSSLMKSLNSEFKKVMPDLIISKPGSAIYSVIDLRNIVPPDFDAAKFVLWCASMGEVTVDGKPTTLLATPMAGFYGQKELDFKNPGHTQLRISYVETRDRLLLVPTLLSTLLQKYHNIYNFK